jgi:hypothetical protein
VVAKVTYQLPKISPRLGAALPDVSEDAFLSSVVNPRLRDRLDDSAPVEPFLYKELSNPHSKAKKLRRFKEYKVRTQQLLTDILSREMKSRGQNNPKEAHKEAMFKWRAQLKKEKDERKKMRWKHKAEVANLERKTARKARKELQQRRLLTELSLKEGPNQLIPKDV